jgi:CO/xanthine dehydrogenase Mo-binding subunit
VNSPEPPDGMGQTGTSAIVLAIANAIFAAANDADARGALL